MSAAFGCYLATDKNALLLYKNNGKTSKPFFLDLNVPEFLHSCTCVLPASSVVFLPLAAPAVRELLQFGVDPFLFMRVQRSRLGGFWSVGWSFQRPWPGAPECAVPGSPLCS